MVPGTPPAPLYLPQDTLLNIQPAAAVAMTITITMSISLVDL